MAGNGSPAEISQVLCLKRIIIVVGWDRSVRANNCMEDLIIVVVVAAVVVVVIIIIVVVGSGVLADLLIGHCNPAVPAVVPIVFCYLWRNGLASRRKSTQVFDMRSTCVSFGHPLAMTCVDFGRAQIRTQVDASFSPFGHPTQVDTS